jgi:hypothetical protein
MIYVGARAGQNVSTDGNDRVWRDGKLTERDDAGEQNAAM